MSAYAASFFFSFQNCLEGTDFDSFCNLIHRNK